LSRVFLGATGSWVGRLLLPTAVCAALSILLPSKSMADDRYAAIVRDLTSGKILHSVAAEELRYPASLTKMMTLYLLFEDLQQGRVSLGTELAVTSNAEVQPPSKLGLQTGGTIEVEDAIKALVTKSANDVAVVVAENLAGSEAAFADRMTRTAYALGMTRTRFRNASGLPDPEQVTTARDMMVLGTALQVQFPRYYAYFKTSSFTFRGHLHKGHNRLIGKVQGVDGIKTGYIRASGFNLVTSAQRSGRRIVAVVMGGTTAKSRDQQMAALIESYLPQGQMRSLAVGERVAAAGADPVLSTSVEPEAPVPAAIKPLKVAAAQGIASNGKAAAYVVQIGAVPSREAALKILRETQAAHADILSGFEPIAAPYKSVVRARYSGFSDRQAASGVCEQLRKKRVTCQVLPL
jgi:D-alanyl-D-alanine carboxypeptidase